MFLLRRISGFILVSFVMGISMGVYAQAAPAQSDDLSDMEFENFVSAVVEVQVIQQKSQEQMVEVVENEGLTVQRFMEIQQAQMNPDDDSEFTDAENVKFVSVSQKLDVIQNKSNEMMEESIVQSGLTINRYQEIGNLIQNDAELQQKFQEVMQAEQ